ncbi:YaaL family protein [Oceanobacillus sp. CAU 1775]
MARRIKKNHIDAQLLKSIFTLEREWKQIQSLGAQSFDRTEESKAMERIARAKYLYLLREARKRNLSALQ